MTAAAEPEPESKDELAILVRRWMARPQPNSPGRTCDEAPTSTLTRVRAPASLPTRRSHLSERCGHSELTRVERHPDEAAEAPVRLAEEPAEVPSAERDDEQALVSMSVDAVDLARNSAVDAVVIVGNPGSMVPLVTRLHGSGVRVVAVGPESTPYGVRARSDDFIDFATLTARPTAGARTRAGRHRA